MQDIFTVHVKSITTENVQTLCVDGSDVEKMRGKRVLIVDDVISTGASLTAIEELVESVGGIIAGRMAVLAEGDACKREDITYLEQLPLFNAKESYYSLILPVFSVCVPLYQRSGFCDILSSIENTNYTNTHIYAYMYV